MKSITKFIVCFLAAVCSLMCIFYLTTTEVYTDERLQECIKKAENLSKNFGMVISEDIENSHPEYDPIIEERINVVEFRISSTYVLEVKYSENNKIMASSIKRNCSFSYVLCFYCSVFSAACFVSAALFIGIDIYINHRERRIQSDRRIKTVHKKHKFLWF